MKLSKRGALMLAFCITALCSLLLLVPILAHQEPDLQTTVANAIDYLEESQEPYGLLWLDVMHRRFGIEEFSDSLQRYDQLLGEQMERWSLLNVFRRIASYDNPMEADVLEDVMIPTDSMIAYALYCDRFGLPFDYVETLDSNAKKGGYYLTHVLLACIWIQENGYEGALPDGFIDKVCHATAVIVNSNPMVVDDLTIEAAAFLYLAGQEHMVDPTFVNRVIASQNDDGGWGEALDGQSGSYWHSTISALVLLLHMQFPADSYPPMLATMPT